MLFCRRPSCWDILIIKRETTKWGWWPDLKHKREWQGMWPIWKSVGSTSLYIPLPGCGGLELPEEVWKHLLRKSGNCCWPIVLVSGHVEGQIHWVALGLSQRSSDHMCVGSCIVLQLCYLDLPVCLCTNII